MDMLVTDSNVSIDDKEVKTFDEFLEEAGSDEGLNVSGLYIDINSVPSEDIYDQLVETGFDIVWCTINGDHPDWFKGELESFVPETQKEESINNDLNPTDTSPLDDESIEEISVALSMMDEEPDTTDNGDTIGRIVTFGSSKGGAGKTFTAIISAVYYAKDHPNERVCLLDLDIEEPQVSTAIRTIKPTLKKFYADYLAGDKSFETMKKYKATNVSMPQNLDFYLTPRDAHVILDNDFWETCMYNLFMNYDMIVFDTGTSYMTLPPIISAYKLADKLNIVTSASLTSSIAVGAQIKRLTGETPNDVYSEEDEMMSKINLIITNTYDDPICDAIVNRMNNEGNIIAEFGILTPKVNQIQVYGKWDYFDDNPAFRKGMRDIMS